MIFQQLADTFGYHSFRPHQEDVVRAILNGQDVFAVMPTGGGKSLCYQLPAKLMDGVCIVVSPLISLMKDQVDAARANGINAATLNSTISREEQRRIGEALPRHEKTMRGDYSTPQRQNEMELLYISPERLNNERFIERLKTLEIAFFAIDEAHCISEWGHDFRPDYLALSRIAEEFPNTPLAAFTATATDRVSNDIVRRLKLRKPLMVRASFNRPNLFYRVVPKMNLNQQLREFLSKRKRESGIIYRQSRKKVEETAELLRREGYSVLPYHAGMSDEARRQNQEAFSRDECQIIVATIAFGMGIDKSNVRFVIHGELPKNMEGYYQETGRAGRDGELAECVLFYRRGDIWTLEKFAKELEDPQQREFVLQQIRRMFLYADNQSECRRAMLLRYFGETYSEPNCGGCDYCCDDAEKEDATIPAQKILSAIVRTGEKFGASHIVDIVVGANTEKIRQFRHQELPTYGVGKEQSKAYWKTALNMLIARNILNVDDPERPVLKLTDAARMILKGRQRFEMVRLIEKETKERRQSAADLPTLSPFGQAVFETLRELRMLLAKEAGVPPYIVFSDRSLHEMALFLPQTDGEFLEITGVGQHKLELYGASFLSAIGKVCETKPEAAEASRKTFKSSKTISMSRPQTGAGDAKPHITPTIEESLRLFQLGHTIEQIAEIRRMSQGTIAQHFEDAVKFGSLFPPERFFTMERLEQIRQWFAESFRDAEGAAAGYVLRLKPAVEASGGELGYDEARLARMLFSQERIQNK
ncbi:MAG: DNA helicase RecQ [Planctomycetaceae bacterium]|nr:DNA helicase RecQ [Planctomycetaceae bacterium]